VPESPVWVALQDARKRGDVDPALEARFRRAPVALLFRGRLLGLTLKTTLVFVLMNLAFYGFSTTFIDYLQTAPATGGLGLDKPAQAPYQLVLNGASLVSILVAGVLSDRISRRLTYAGLCVLGAVGSAFLFQITRDAAGAVPGALLLVLAVVMISYGVNGVIGTITAEIFPTHLRSTGPGFCQNVGKGLGGLAGPPLAGALVTRQGYPLVLALPGALLFVLALLIWSLPRADAREVRPVEADDYLAT
jgi:MFS family permease